jgi:putative Ca2+/H+ antiporter (TMEM165/GDT1 family)
MNMTSLAIVPIHSWGAIRVDWKVMLSTFGLIFIAELGDKTQLTTMMLAAQTDAPRAVFLGAALALALSALLGVVFGEAVTRVVPAHFIHFAAGIAFIGLGIVLVLGKM